MTGAVRNKLMNKETVLLEIVDEFNPKVVSVIPFDLDNKIIMGDSIIVTTRQEAYEKYEVVGEIVLGEIQLNGINNTFEEEDGEE